MGFGARGSFKGGRVPTPGSMTFYPDAHPETFTVDGYTRQTIFTDTWANVHNAVGNDAADGNAQNPACNIITGPTAGKWQSILRSVFLFKTSGLPKGVIVTGAVFSLRGSGKIDECSITPDINVYACNPASNTALVGADYSTFGATPLSTAITYANWKTNAYNDFIINDISVIKKSGITRLGTRNAQYDADNVEPAWNGALKSSYLLCYFADAGGNFRPKLVVTYT